jgi:hypothetical protein
MVKMQKNEANFEVFVLQAETASFDKVDAMAYFSNKDLPLEIVTRLDYLWDKTVEVGGQVVNVGKILVVKLIKFITDNPSMAFGVAIGIGLGVLVGMIPFIGSFIAPIVTAIAATYGALRGHRLDKIMKGEYSGDSLMEDAITIAKQFWALLADIFHALFLDNPLVEG